MADVNWFTNRLPIPKPPEPRRVLEQLVRALRRQGEEDPEMARWYVRRLASVFDVPFTVGHPKPLEHTRILANEIVRVLEEAGGSPSSRIEAAGVAVELAGALGEVMAGWRDEADAGPHCPVSPPTPP